MSLKDHEFGTREGTRFRLFPQPPFLEGFEEPETVWLSPPAGTIGPGPADDRMYAVYPLDKLVTYGTRIGPHGEKFNPPWTGPAFPPALPDEDGHFDHLEVGTPEFEAAHFYATARFVLDIWEGYFDRPIDWHFGDLYERMELVIMPRFNNATMGYGFMEVGGYELEDGEHRSFSLNFDIIGHEVGHSIIYPIVGLPSPETEHDDYYGFHEAAADLVGLIATLHFDSVVDQLLAATSGNLYALNKLNRIGELTETEQIRVAANDLRVSDFADGWTDEHAISQPLTAAIFDIMVDIFHELLVERGVIGRAIEDLLDELEDAPHLEPVMQSLFDEIYAENPDAIRGALLDARDHVGTYLAATFALLTPELTYGDVAEALLEAEHQVTGGRFGAIFRENLAVHEIGLVPIGPRLTPPGEESHFHSVRTEKAMEPCGCRRCRPSYRACYARSGR